MASNLFVGNLPFSVTEQDLRQLFGGVGEVSKVDIIMDKFSGRPRGFAFVEMTTPEAAGEAIAKLDGYEMDGRKIGVREATPRAESGDRGRGPRRFGNDNRGGGGFGDRRGGFGGGDRRTGGGGGGGWRGGGGPNRRFGGGGGGDRRSGGPNRFGGNRGSRRSSY